MWEGGYQTALPLRYTIEDTSDIKYLFTEHHSAKSGSLMKMIQSAYGKNQFNQGIIVKYIKLYLLCYHCQPKSKAHH